MVYFVRWFVCYYSQVSTISIVAISNVDNIISSIIKRLLSYENSHYA